MKNHILQGVDTIVLKVSDISTAKEWYTEKLGLTTIHEDEDGFLLVMNTYGPTSLTMLQHDDDTRLLPISAPCLIFKTGNASYARQALKDRGVTVGELFSDDTNACFTFKDPDGNTFEVCQNYDAPVSFEMEQGDFDGNDFFG
jgi:catechol 2,3-dioxygenase-like lactoylglutathione lyase family enzyme